MVERRSRVRFGFISYGLDRPAFGISRAALNLGRALQRTEQADPVFLTPYRHGPFADQSTAHVHVRYAGLAPGLMTLGAAHLPVLARKHALPLIHDPTGIGPFIPSRRLAGFKRVLTLHDATPLQYPEKHTVLTRFVYRRYLPVVLPTVDAIITLSQSAAQDLMRLLRVSPERIHVVPLAADASFRPVGPEAVRQVLDLYRISQPYVLYVGALEPRKNIPGLLRAFMQVRQQVPGIGLVLAGGRRWQSSGLDELIRKLGLQNAVISTGYISDDDLPALYSGASVFCFPSIAEGFGLPILEAMACGTPVVCSNISSMPDVAGEAALLVDPFDAGSIADGLAGVLADRQKADMLRERGVDRARQFSWDRTAQRTLDVYTNVLASNG